MENIILLILGLCISILGFINFRGNISSIHRYNRKNITKENYKLYGKTMGIGSMIIGIALILTAVLQFIVVNENIWFIAALGCVIGLAFMLYGQFKYNKGIF